MNTSIPCQSAKLCLRQYSLVKMERVFLVLVCVHNLNSLPSKQASEVEIIYPFYRGAKRLGSDGLYWQIASMWIFNYYCCLKKLKIEQKGARRGRGTRNMPSACNPSTWEAELGGQQVQGQHLLYGELKLGLSYRARSGPFLNTGQLNMEAHPVPPSWEHPRFSSTMLTLFSLVSIISESPVSPSALRLSIGCFSNSKCFSNDLMINVVLLF